MLIADKIFIRLLRSNGYAKKTLRNGVCVEKFLLRCAKHTYQMDGMLAYSFRDGSQLLSRGGVLTVDF